MKLVIFFFLLSAVCQTSSLPLGNSSWLSLICILQEFKVTKNFPGWTKCHLWILCPDEAEASGLQLVDEAENNYALYHHTNSNQSDYNLTGDISGKTEPSHLFALCQEKMTKLDSFQWTHIFEHNLCFHLQKGIWKHIQGNNLVWGRHVKHEPLDNNASICY